MVALRVLQLALISISWFSHQQVSDFFIKKQSCAVMILLPLQISQALEREVIVHQNSKQGDKMFLFR